jgi:hypothetical protein
MVINKNCNFGFDIVGKLLNKFKSTDWENISERNDMSLVGIDSMQLLHHHFIGNSISNTIV